MFLNGLTAFILFWHFQTITDKIVTITSSCWYCTEGFGRCLENNVTALLSLTDTNSSKLTPGARMLTPPVHVCTSLISKTSVAKRRSDPFCLLQKFFTFFWDDVLTNTALMLRTELLLLKMTI